MSRIQKSIIFEDVKNYVHYVCDRNNSWSQDLYLAITFYLLVGVSETKFIDWMCQDIIEYFNDNKYWLGSKTCDEAIENLIESQTDMNIEDINYIDYDMLGITIDDVINTFKNTGAYNLLQSVYEKIDDIEEFNYVLKRNNLYPRDVINILQSHNADDHDIADFILTEHYEYGLYNIRQAQVDWANTIVS